MQSFSQIITCTNKPTSSFYRPVCCRINILGSQLSPSSINLVPGQAGKVTVGLASHWPWVTDTVVYPPTGSTAKDREMSTHAYVPSGRGRIYLTLSRCRINECWGPGHKLLLFITVCRLATPFYECHSTNLKRVILHFGEYLDGGARKMFVTRKNTFENVAATKFVGSLFGRASERS